MAGKGHDITESSHGRNPEDVHEGIDVVFFYQVQVLNLDLLLCDELLYDLYQFLLSLLFFLQALLDFFLIRQCVHFKASLHQFSFLLCDLSVEERSMEGRVCIR